MNKHNPEWDFETREKKQERRLLFLRFTISTLFGILGILIIFSQLIPLTNSFLQGKLLENQEETLAKPLPDSYKQYIQGEFAYYAPDETYFLNLTRQAQAGYGQSKEVVVDTNYKENMWIDIDSVGIERIKIASNVESSDENVYNRYLKDGVAHFKGTPLPGDGGNSFIYGHSAINNFFRSHPDLPETIFTRLENVDIGDVVKIDKDEQSFAYTVRRKHIAEANDFSVFNTSSNRETVTLMTCWPIGIGSKRLILVAELNES